MGGKIGVGQHRDLDAGTVIIELRNGEKEVGDVSGQSLNCLLGFGCTVRYLRSCRVFLFRLSEQISILKIQG